MSHIDFSKGVPLPGWQKPSEEQLKEEKEFLERNSPTGRAMQVLVLSVHRNRFRMDDADAEPADEEFRLARPAALESQHHSCWFCRHSQKGFMQVHHLNCIHGDNTPENLKVVDFICHACCHLYLAGTSRSKDGRGGQMIYLPGVEQSLLNRFLMGLFAQISHGDPAEQAKATRLYKELQQLSEPIIQKYGTDDAMKFGQMLNELPQTVYEQRFALFSGIRYLMSQDSFMYQPGAISAMAAAWRSFFPKSSWESVRAQVFDVVTSA